MKITYVSASQVPSDKANSIQVMKVCQAFAQLGHSVTLLVPDQAGDMISRPIAPDGRSWESLSRHYGLHTRFEIVWLPLSPLWKRRGYSFTAVNYAAALGSDLLYARSLPPALLGLLRRIPVVMEIHQMPSGWLGPWGYYLFLLLPGEKRLLPLTHALLAALESRYRRKLDEAQVLVAPSGVDVERFASLPGAKAARIRLGLPPKPTVACTGHLYAGRGADLFLDLAAGMPQVNFIWVGGRSQDVAYWQSRATAAGISNAIFAGFVPNQQLPLYQAAADVLLLPYSQKVAGSGGGDLAGVFSPMKMFEYMAAGRAILCSDLPVLREVLKEEFAVFCPADDAPAWQYALRSLLRDANHRQSLGRRARAEVDKYTWIQRARRTLEGFPERR